MSRRGAAFALLLTAAACRGTPREPLITYFSADHGLSIRYPSSWRTEQAEQDGVWYRYFLGPPQGPQAKPAVSVTLLAGPLGQSLEDYSQTYLAGNSLASSKPETRQGLPAQSYTFASADGATRYSLLLVQDGPRVYGLYSQGEVLFVEQNATTLDEIFGAAI